MSQLHWMSNVVSDMNMGQGQHFVVSQMSLQGHQHGPQRLDLQQPPKATCLFTNSAQLLQPRSLLKSLSTHPHRLISRIFFDNLFTKTGTPTHTANSPFIPSPSITLTAPSSISEDPVMSVSPSLSEFTAIDSNQRNTVMQETDCAAECQLEHLCRVVKSISPEAFRSAVSDIRSIVSIVDGITEPVPGIGHRMATKLMKRDISTRSVNASSSVAASIRITSAI